MRRIVIALMGTVSGLVLLFSYHTSTGAGSVTAAGTAGGSPGGGSTDSSEGSGSVASSDGAAGPVTYTGDPVMTRWGVVQVRITVADGRITAAEAVQVPSENPRDREINAYAVPVLNDEVLASQSADVDAVSGATVTSDGYRQSLQSAIDEAHL